MSNRATAFLVLGCAIATFTDAGVQATTRALSKPAAGRRQPAPAPAAPNRQLLDTYCTGCHNERLKTAGLMLDTLDPSHVDAHPEIWEKVVRKLKAGAMPPTGSRRPDNDSQRAFVEALEGALDGAAAAAPDPGRPAIHRLNRTEYTNAIRDLLTLDVDGESLLPSDTSSYGFDNIGDVLTLSPVLLERYMSAAHKIGQLAVGSPTSPYLTVYRASPLFDQNSRIDEDLPFGSRGGLAVRHYFPLDADYNFKITFQQIYVSGGVRGATVPNEAEFRIDGVLVKKLTLAPETRKRPSLGGSGPEEDNTVTPSPGPRLDDGIEFQIPVKSGMRKVAVTFRDRVLAPEGAAPARPPCANNR